MNGIVRIALQRPLTFIVMALIILIFGGIAAVTTPADIFPDIKIPSIAVAWQYTGLSADDMAGRVMYPFERTVSTLVSDVEHMESNSIAGIGIERIFFQPGVDVRTATAQITAGSQTTIKNMPAGMTAPIMINYSASTVPILQLALGSKTLSEQQIFDFGANTIRPALVNVRGVSSPNPYGGKQRQVVVDLDPVALQSKGLSAQDVQAAIAAQSQQTPAGTAKIGSYVYTIDLNNTPEAIDDLNNLPVKTVNGATIYIRDVAHVRDGSSPQTNIVHVDGRRAVLMTILKSGSASTIAVVDGIKAALPRVRTLIPPSLNVGVINDQSLFVKAALQGVIREGALAAALTSLMILLFLGSWRSTVIIALSIPLAVLAAIFMLAATGQTLNIMTLGGLALAVGILVDDATVTIENINWHLDHGKEVKTAILDGARQIVAPAFVSLLCICVVFVPMFALKGVAGYLFVPMALSVIFSMVASFVLSRTFVPTMAMYLLKRHAAHGPEGPKPTRNPLVLFQRGFEARFDGAREGYRNLLAMAMTRRKLFVTALIGAVLLSFGLGPFLGSNFFPAVDAGQIILHVRAPVGMRIEETSDVFSRVESEIRKVIPPRNVKTIVDNIGVPNSSINLIYSNSGVIGASDGDIYITLDRKGAKPTAEYVRQLREVLPREFPSSTFSFLPADIVSQILNFGSPAPLDVQITGPDRTANEALALKLMRDIAAVRGAADVRLQQSSHNPLLRVDIDRTRIGQIGLSERDVTSSLGTTLAGSGQLAPLYWLNPVNGVVYPIVVQAPEYRIGSISDLANVPVTGSGRGGMQVLGGLGSITRGEGNVVNTHYNITPAFDIYAAVQGRDLGATAHDVQKVLDGYKARLPRGSALVMRGQIETMNTAFTGLFVGILGAIVLIYLIIVVNFQSWLDPFVIITALPAALAGIVWTLFATGTTLSVPALTGAIMCMGVATANSILVVSFARERLHEHGDPVVAAVEAGFTRFRPVLMTALAMIIGMLPMALALGEGGEQNAPLGRAVIGGLVFATGATLFFVPVVFSLVHGRKHAAPASDQEPDADAFAGEAAYAAQ
ncbi:MAG: efflux RND transporter permease subunit [Caulobacteraceae bacterium]